MLLSMSIDTHSAELGVFRLLLPKGSVKNL